MPHDEAPPLQTLIQRSEAEAAKAFPMLWRHAPGTMVPHRLDVVSDAAVQQWRAAGVPCTALRRESNVPKVAKQARASM